MFLVTTSLHEYQDKADDLLFLGEWCLPGRDKDMIPPGKEYRVLPYLWQDPVERRDAYGFCKTFYDRAISGLAGLMNEIHETNLSDRYWKILVGPWLLFYTHVLYDRYRCIVKAFREYPGARTAGISPSSFWTIYDWHHYTAGVINDYYNLQLYCQIMTALGISYEVRDDGPWRAGLQRTMDSSYYLAASGNKTRLCRQAIHKGLAWIFNGKNRKTVVSGLFNRNINHYFLAAATGFQVGILPRVPRDLEEIRRANRPSQELRRSFDTIELDSPDQIFSKVFAKTLAHNFPCCYLEDFRRR
ncbi:MAG: hypothetical protein KAI75_11015, partial [Desulfobulbaceae bacterium]|nr:hypothetical protein [Desulfobulbaceae bacterium]